MTPDEARAAGLALAIGYCWHARVAFITVMDLADQFTAYIRSGAWPREAVSTDGQSGEEGKGPDASVGEQAGEARDGEPIVHQNWSQLVPGGSPIMGEPFSFTPGGPDNPTRQRT